MKRQNLAIISIIAIGSLTSIVYATSTSISDSGITTPTLTTNTLTVTGSCSGCGGGGEGNFNSYTMITNSTFNPNSGSLGTAIIKVSNDGSLSACLNAFKDNIIIFKNATILKDLTSSTTNCSANNYSFDQSIFGEYKILLDAGHSGNLYIYKNNILLQTITIQSSQSAGGDLSTSTIGISGNGKYIDIVFGDSGGTLSRLIVFEGS